MIFAVLFVGGVVLLAGLTGGVGSAIAGGGREDNSLLTNAFIGFVGWLIAGFIWAQVYGAWPEELSIGFLLLTLACSIGVAWLRTRRSRRTAERVRVHDRSSVQ